jgi:hypothetical protein
MPITRQVVPGAAPAGSQPGLLTVTDFAARYNVDPLYQQGITGKGGALGIVTFANFTPGCFRVLGRAQSTGRRTAFPLRTKNRRQTKTTLDRESPIQEAPCDIFESDDALTIMIAPFESGSLSHSPDRCRWKISVFFGDELSGFATID